MRYRGAKSLDPTTMTTFRDLIPTKLAAAVWNCLMKYKANLPNFPQSETCELLILDRSIDQVSSYLFPDQCLNILMEFQFCFVMYDKFIFHFRSLQLYMNGHMMPCAMIY